MKNNNKVGLDVRLTLSDNEAQPFFWLTEFPPLRVAGLNSI